MMKLHKKVESESFVSRVFQKKVVLDKCKDCSNKILETDEYLKCEMCDHYYCVKCMLKYKKEFNSKAIPIQVDHEVEGFAINNKYLIVWS